ncbi:MAG: DEAD/DEAH box helicase [Thermoplasmataceae archaeon]
MKTFEDLGIRPELTSSLKKMSFINPTEVQEVTIPLILSMNDVTVRSKTGSGKTGAFLIPIIDRIEKRSLPEVLVVLPTRELALQVSDVAQKMSRAYKLKVVTVYGGASINVQINSLRTGANIVVGTPGRILDLIERKELDLSGLRFLVLDEADIMLDMGFIDDIKLIISHTPKSRQTLLFSATMPKEIVELAKKYMNRERKNITIGEEEKVTVETISHYYSVTDQNNKFAMLMAYFSQYKPDKSIIFTNTKDMANRIYATMKKNGFTASIIHGDISQAEREKAMNAFRNGESVLVATNVAARGLDIPDITDIINYDAPDDPIAYIHRVGRSARMGKEGRAYTIINDSQKRLIREIKQRANIEMVRIEMDTDEFADMKLVSRERSRRNVGSARRGDHGRRDSGQRRYNNYRSRQNY